MFTQLFCLLASLDALDVENHAALIQPSNLNRLRSIFIRGTSTSLRGQHLRSSVSS